MKKIFLLSSLLFCFQSYAAILDVNSADKTVYYHPTPALEINLVDYDDGGYLTVFINYESDVTRNERNDLQAKYPGTTAQAIMAEPQQASGSLTIDQTDIHINIPMRQGQVGPYVNVQTTITKDQMRQVLAVKSRLQNLIHVSLPVRSNFTESTVVEQYVASPQVCSDLKVRTARDMILALTHLQKPASIKYQQTFDALKTEILDHCFETSLQSIGSFKDLLNASVQTSSSVGPITAQYLEKRSLTENYELNPQIKINLN